MWPIIQIMAPCQGISMRLIVIIWKPRIIPKPWIIIEYTWIYIPWCIDVINDEDQYDDRWCFLDLSNEEFLLCLPSNWLLCFYSDIFLYLSGSSSMVGLVLFFAPPDFLGSERSDRSCQNRYGCSYLAPQLNLNIVRLYCLNLNYCWRQFYQLSYPIALQ